MTSQPHDVSGVPASERMGLDSEVRELKFGDSFRDKGNSFHTIRYDFKPASVDTSKMATLDVQGGQVTISMPQLDGSGTTGFTGPRKQYAKECVLIIDPDTGECVLEKLHHSIQVKKTRQEGSSRMSKYVKDIVPKDNISTSSGPPEAKRPAPSHHRVESSKPLESSSAFETKHNKSKPPTTSRKSHQQPPIPRTPPMKPSPERFSPPSQNNSYAIDSYPSVHQHPPPPNLASTMPSLTNFDDLLTAGPSPGTYPSPPSATLSRPKSSNPPQVTPPASKKAISSALSESSSSSSSSASSSDDSSDNDDDSSSDDDMEVVSERNALPSLPNISSFSNGTRSQKQDNPAVSRSIPYCVSEDLQLSESGSDSD